ncbi:hypothetical protein BDV96DRAFT_328388 [Lophiotrema nucula]|uniref:Uncharacterized protein n=1 Tax=Lophiotrema nucula TaxID=690887 RepID=A0A6A5YHD8_9PLEO|nr:hypothetical protein BDV96DRAFT_328388 [Lophiotrema nucula]
MESSTEVLRVVNAIVIAFQTAADTLDIIIDRKERKKRKKDKEVEELLEIRILHKSLVEGGTRCRKHCENKHQQFSPAFEAGDDIAILALKDVVISLQTEVIQALHIARAVENAVLDFTTLHESSVTNRKDATRAMDQLCQRIMASMQFQPQHGANKSEARIPSDSSMRSSSASMRLSDPNEWKDLPPTPPASVGSPRQPYQRALPQRTLTIRRPSDRVGQRGRYNAPQISPQASLQISPPTSSQTSPLGWISSQIKHANGDLAAGHASSSAAGEEQQSHQDPEDLDAERRSQFSIQYSAYESDKGSILVQPTSVTSPTTSRHLQDPTPRGHTASEQPPQQRSSSARKEPIHDPRDLIQNNESTLSEEAQALIALSRATKERPLCLPRIETADDLQRAFEAPEVVSADFEGMYHVDQSNDKYTAFLSQADYAERLLSLPPGLENIWTPLKRPAMHNRYHGFCKGAWQIRKMVHEGLDLELSPDLQNPVIHWTCKECKFRSKAPNVDSLPNHILFNQKYNIRYRWLFLAKSHRVAENSCDSPEFYKYGCIFCAAQGHTTAAYDKLDHLMVHVISKHKTKMMTPEVKEKTKCIVGSVVDQRQDWDINVPESNQKGAGVAADEFFISASKFFNRRKGKRL